MWEQFPDALWGTHFFKIFKILKLEFSKSWKNDFFKILERGRDFPTPRIDQISDRLTGPTNVFLEK